MNIKFVFDFVDRFVGVVEVVSFAMSFKIGLSVLGVVLVLFAVISLLLLMRDKLQAS